MNEASFRTLMAGALDLVRTEAGPDLQALFGDWIIDEPGLLSVAGARAAGLLEGAAAALDVTVLELLDALDLE